MSDKDKVQRLQDLRRSSAASPVDRTPSRSEARRKAIQEQEYNEDGTCKGACVYGTCGGGPSLCGGCCSCLGGCEMGREEALLASDEALRRTDPEWEETT